MPTNADIAYTRGIMQPDGTRCYTGPECKRHGDFNRAVVTAMGESMEEFVAAAMDSYMAKRQYIEDHGVTPEEWQGLFKGESQFGGLVVETPILGEQGRYREDPAPPVSYDYSESRTPSDNYYGSSARITGGHVETPVDLEAVATWLFNPRTETAKQAAIAFMRNNNFNSTDAYEVYGIGDYYGEHPSVRMSDEYAEKAKTWLRQFPNANDPDGLYAWARELGLDSTQNLSPRDALLTALLDRTSPKVPTALRNKLNRAMANEANGGWRKIHLTEGQHQTNGITVDERILARTEAAPEAPPTGTTRNTPYAGIVIEQTGEQGTTLLEGYANYKKLQELGTRASRRRYLKIVLPATGN